MNEVIEHVATTEDLTKLTLEDLFNKAATYGRINVFATDNMEHPKRYQVDIHFESVPGTSVEASSEFDMEINEAFIQAITRAQKIVESYGKA